MDISFCEYIQQIEKDPFKKIDNLTGRDLYALRDHIDVCTECSNIVDSILEKHKDVLPDPNNGWNKTKYN